MTSSLEKLTRISGPQLGSLLVPATLSTVNNAELETLTQLLQKRNGFYAFESCLHVFPLETTDASIGVVGWNESTVWRSEYHGRADPGLFFAEDVFGNQFALKGSSVMTFDPELGDFEPFAETVDEWAQRIVEEPEIWTGHPLGRQWQEANGPIPSGSRLTPVTPFVLGGDYAIDNLRAVNAIEGMRHRAAIARQIRDLPDGSRVSLTVTN